MNLLYIVSLEAIVNSGIFKSQVQELLARLSKGNREITLLYFYKFMVIRRRGIEINSFNRSARDEVKKVFEDHGVRTLFVPFLIPCLNAHGIRLNWIYLIIYVLYCVPILLILMVRRRYHVIHCRSYLPCVLAVICTKILRGAKIIFDMRGFLPEEGIEHGTWKRGSLNHRIWIRIERHLIVNSSRVVALSQEFSAQVKSIFSRCDVDIVYAGVDVTKFRRDDEARGETRGQLGLKDKMVLIYVGGLGSWNDPEIVVNVFSALEKRCKNSFLIILTGYDSRRLDEMLGHRPDQERNYLIQRCSPDEVLAYLNAADYGIVPGRTIGTGQVAESLTNSTMIGLKVAEYLGYGLPVIANARICAVRSLVEREGVGCLFREGEMGDLDKVEEVNSTNYLQMSKRCRELAERKFSLDSMEAGYRGIYDSLLSEADREAASR